MNIARTSIIKNRSIFLFISIIFLFGIITGILFYFKQDKSVLESIIGSLESLFKTPVFSVSTIFYHFIILLLLIATLFCFIGLPLLLLYIFFEGIGIGFLLPLFFSLYKINFLWYFLVYFIFIKLIYFLLLFFLFTKFFTFLKYYIVCLRKKSYDFLSQIKYIFLFLVFILANDCLVYFVGNHFVSTLLG